VDIRLLHAVDASAYRDLRLQALSTNPEAFLTTYDDYLSRPFELVTNQLTPDDDHFTVGAYVGDASDQLVGTVTLVRERATKARHIANVVALFVSPNFQRQGIGRELLADLIQRARQMDGLVQFRLSVVKDNDAATKGGLNVNKWICTTCGTQYAQNNTPPAHAPFAKMNGNTSDPVDKRGQRSKS